MKLVAKSKVRKFESLYELSFIFHASMFFSTKSIGSRHVHHTLKLPKNGTPALPQIYLLNAKAGFKMAVRTGFKKGLLRKRP